MRCSSFTLSLLFTMSATITSAAGVPASLNSVIHATQQTIEDLKQVQIQSRLDLSLQMIVNQGAQALIDGGHVSEAAQLVQEWKIIQQRFFFGTESIGDHKPLSDWLAKEYKMLEAALGKTAMEVLHLNDLFIINYAVPVVIHPEKNWGRSEYGRHFNPLAGVLVHWSSFSACMSVIAKLPRSAVYCDRLSMVLRKHVASDIAPPLANFVYTRFHDSDFRLQFTVTEADLVRLYGTELLQIQY